MKVILESYTQNPLEIVYKAYRTCYSKVSPSEISLPINETSIGDIPDKEKMIKFINDKLELGHESPFEHANFTFFIEGISRACSHQLVRHRLASYSQQSQRYVEGIHFDYVIPPSIRQNAEAERRFKQFIKLVNMCYMDLRSFGINKEDARYILPNATTTNLVVTMNGRELRHFLKIRLDRAAQWEIRELAEKMLEESVKILPCIGYEINKGE